MVTMINKKKWTSTGVLDLRRHGYNTGFRNS